MISLNQFLHGGGSDQAEALRRATSLILEGLALHAIAVDDYDRSTFRDAIRKCNRELTNDWIASDESMAVARSTIQVLEAHSRSTEQQMNARVREFQCIVSLLTAAMARAYRGSHETVDRIQNIEGLLQKASQLDDLRAVKTKLKDCLSTVREESTRQAGLSNGFGAVIGIIRRPVVQAALQEFEPDDDPVTGLPGRRRCEAALEEALAGSGMRLVVPLMVAHCSAMARRLGEEGSHKLAFMIGQSLGQKRHQQDRLFRWSDPCFVALLERHGQQMEIVQREISGMSGLRMELTIQVGSRLVLVPVTLSSLVIPLSEHPALGRVREQIEAFAANPG